MWNRLLLVFIAMIISACGSFQAESELFDQGPVKPSLAEIPTDGVLSLKDAYDAQELLFSSNSQLSVTPYNINYLQGIVPVSVQNFLLTLIKDSGFQEALIGNYINPKLKGQRKLLRIRLAKEYPQFALPTGQILTLGAQFGITGIIPPSMEHNAYVISVDGIKKGELDVSYLQVMDNGSLRLIYSDATFEEVEIKEIADLFASGGISVFSGTMPKPNILVRNLLQLVVDAKFVNQNTLLIFNLNDKKHPYHIMMRDMLVKAEMPNEYLNVFDQIDGLVISKVGVRVTLARPVSWATDDDGGRATAGTTLTLTPTTKGNLTFAVGGIRVQNPNYNAVGQVNTMYYSNNTIYVKWSATYQILFKERPTSGQYAYPINK